MYPFLRKKKLTKVNPTIAESVFSDGYKPMAPEALLLDPSLIHLVDVFTLARIRHVHERDLKTYFVPLVRHAAKIFQLMPASLYSHHVEPGGAMFHSLDSAQYIHNTIRVCLRDRSVRGGFKEELERRSRRALILCAGLFHDVGKLVTDVRILGFTNAYPDRPLTYRATIDALVEKPPYDWMIENNISRYKVAYIKNRKRGAHNQFVLPFIDALLTKMGLVLTEVQAEALRQSDSSLQRGLLEGIRVADQVSVESYREEVGQKDTRISEQLRFALLYAAEQTNLLKGTAKEGGRIFVSSERLNLIAESLPDFHEFISVRHSPQFEHLLLANDLAEPLGPGQLSHCHDGRSGLFLNPADSTVEQVISLVRAERAPIPADDSKSDDGSLVMPTRKVSTRTRDFLRALLKLNATGRCVEETDDSIVVNFDAVRAEYPVSAPGTKTLIRSLMSDGLLADRSGANVELSISLEEVVKVVADGHAV